MTQIINNNKSSSSSKETYSFRLHDFEVFNTLSCNSDSENSDESTDGIKRDNKEFEIQMYGMNESGETCAILVKQYNPFFYVKLPSHISSKSLAQTKTRQFVNNLKSQMGEYYAESLCNVNVIDRKDLYGFDGGKSYFFMELQFQNNIAFNKAKRCFIPQNGVYVFLQQSDIYQLYEANIPPLLRYFHIKNISPSGWIQLPHDKYIQLRSSSKLTTCKYEFTINYNDVIPLNDKETSVPYKICSFDIEAGSSHGDFPLPVKSYKKLATNIVDYIVSEECATLNDEDFMAVMEHCIFSAFDLCEEPLIEIDRVYPKRKVDVDVIERLFETWYSKTLGQKKTQEVNQILKYLENSFQKQENEEEIDSLYPTKKKKLISSTSLKSMKIYDLLTSNDYEYDEKITHLDKSLTSIFPRLKGDPVTFIGSTFWKYGEKEPYLNHCIALDTCNKINAKNTKIESYKTEASVLLAWTKLIQREDPDVIIGYNIFGFDYEFMFRRSIETRCMEDFVQLSRRKNELCFKHVDKEDKIEESKIVIASGEHDLKYIKMSGRIQVDLYNYLRRDYPLPSYKLDYVAGHFIGDGVKEIQHEESKTIIYTKNMKGLNVDSFIHFEESSHSVDYYKDGAKFKISSMDLDNNTFTIDSIEHLDMTKSVRWALAKDDVTPQDIFRMTKEGPKERAVIAKYCIQDCNLVHYLMNKIDVMTGFIEMAKICSVPISFLVLRGQGIKLTSFISQKCREKDTLMPVIEKSTDDDGYEGAIVLEPKCDLYLDDPVACVDYGSLYPSSMISENLCHSSKVWTKEYNLKNELVCTTGELDATGNYKYDNLSDYQYVDITYDTFAYIRRTPKGAAEKIKKGYKICRFAQYPDGKKAILPSVLEQLLASRKATKKLMAKETEPFMKNILDKRQLSIKLTANSLYGQCGAKTSTFYEKDVAASTTATGRKLLTYAKRVIEEVYGDTECETSKFGLIRTKAEYVYGDTDSVFFKFNPETLDRKPIRGKDALEITIELAQEAGALATKFLKKPHDLEYEKTFMPFCLLSKKRYVGMLYETDPNKCKQKSMGIVLKRRDNAPIVKDIYGGIIDILMKEGNIVKAVNFLQDCLQKMMDEQYPLEKLIITKSLRSNYKNPKQIAHKVLADRIAKRDPGNKPSSGDRIPFVYIHNPSKKALQGERIETPTYIIENNIKPNYSFYITNQIMKPVQQLFALVLEKIWLQKKQATKMRNFKREVEKMRKEVEEEKYYKKREDMRNKEVKKLLFDEYLTKIDMKNRKEQDITKFFMRR